MGFGAGSLGSEAWTLGSRVWSLGLELRFRGPGFRVQGPGLQKSVSSGSSGEECIVGVVGYLAHKKHPPP